MNFIDEVKPLRLIIAAAISIPTNIAEGSQRGSDKDFQRFLFIASGSNAE